MTAGELPDDLDGVPEIAIVGASGRFPGADDVAALWQLLVAGREGIRRFTRDELIAAGEPAELVDHPAYVPARGVIADPDRFDAGLFRIAPRDAELMDPQLRVLLECAHEALEDAAIRPDRFPGPIAVYAGAGAMTYVLNLLQNAAALSAADGMRVQNLNAADSLATMIAYKLGLRGPAVTVQTACSTSLVAVALACRSLLAYEADLALAGGVSLPGPHDRGYLHSEGHITSPDGHCRAFDAGARGTVGSGGAGLVVLRRLDDAVRAGDRILAVIKGFAINNDGASKVAFTAPSETAQEEVIALAMRVAGVEPDTIEYVEAHGTGTVLGDPIEVRALRRAFAAGTARRQFCALGSIKTNLGHLDAAAGVAGLIKAALCLHHRTLVPTLHFTRPNPALELDQTPFFVDTAVRAWPGADRRAPRRAGVSSFGVGGTNVHLVLEEAPPPAAAAPAARPFQLLILSARTPTALDALTARWVDHLAGQPAGAGAMADLAATAALGRRELEHRRAVVCRDARDAAGALTTPGSPRRLDADRPATARSVVFLFPGGGAQYPGMARDLYRDEPRFRSVLDDCFARLRIGWGLDLARAVYPDAGGAAELERPSLALPAIFSVEYALTALWRSWGIEPAALLGHSLGEYVAACVAGVFSLDDALELVVTRGRLFERAGGGAMLSVALPADQLEPLLEPGLSIAAVNAPEQCVASGERAAIQALARRLAERDIDSRLLHLDAGAHSPRVDPFLPAFRAQVARMTLQPPALPLLSNVTGTWLLPDQATDPDYWVRHLRNTVQFSRAVALLAEQPDRLYLEVGPGTSLGSLVRQHRSHGAAPIAYSSLRHPRSDDHDQAHLLGVLGRMWLDGVAPDWSQVHGPGRRRVAIPTYPFERERYWIAPDRTAAPAPAAPPPAPTPADTAWFRAPVWKHHLRRRPAPDRRPRHWLLLTPDEPWWREVGAALGGASDDVTHLACRAPDRWIAGAGDATDAPGPLAALVARMAPAADRPIAVVYAAAAQSRDGAAPGADHDAGDVVALTELAQALEQRLPGRTSALVVVTDRLYRVGGGEALEPAGAPAAMAALVFAQEHATLRTASLDVDRGALGTAPGAAAALVAAVRDEIDAELPDRIVARRGRLRFTPALEPIGSPDAGAHRRWLDPGGTYVITGGLGAIGLALADLMARAAPGVCLVLVSRRELSPRDAVRDLERAGARVIVARADASSPAELRTVLQRAHAERGRLDGILHAAGIAEGRIVQLEDAARIRRVIGAKLTSARVVAALADELGAGFVALFSSLNGVSGGAGHLAYAAANAGLDAIAHARWGLPTRFVSINWGAWQIGMMEQVKSARGLGASPDPEVELSALEGFDALGWILDQTDLPQVTASRPLPMNQLLGADDGPATAATGPGAAPAAPAGPADVRQIVLAAWTTVLGHRDLPLDANVFTLGADSLICVQLVRLLGQRLGVRVPVTDVFEFPTPAGLIAAIERRLAERARPADPGAAGSPPGTTDDDDVLRASIERGRRTRERRRGRG